MKKKELIFIGKTIVISAVAIVVICLGCVGLKNKSESKNATYARQSESYFPEGEERFVLVDQSKQKIGNEYYICKVFADKYMLTMYLWVEEIGSGAGSLTQIFYEDGSPMIYDDETLWD